MAKRVKGVPTAFSMRQRVWVPGHDRVQGVVTRVTVAEQGITYFLRWLSPTGLGQEGWSHEDDLLTANPQEGA